MLRFGNIVHIRSILVLIVSFFGLYFLFRNRSDKAKKILVLVIMGLNLFQHLFKFIVWPHVYGKGFTLNDTAYNFCALMIIVGPIFFFTKLRGVKSFLAILGAFAGLIAVCVPFWFNGVDVSKFPLSSEYARFFTCHLLLFLSSSLQIVFGLVSFKWTDFYKVGICVIVGLIIIFVNDLVFLSITKGSISGGMDKACFENPVFMFGPKYGSGFDWAMDLLVAICPPFLKIDALRGFVPILWYVVPVYILFSIGGFILYILLDKTSFIYKKNIKE